MDCGEDAVALSSALSNCIRLVCLCMIPAFIEISAWINQYETFLKAFKTQLLKAREWAVKWVPFFAFCATLLELTEELRRPMPEQVQWKRLAPSR